jgi:hypothetical protein
MQKWLMSVSLILVLSACSKQRPKANFVDHLGEDVPVTLATPFNFNQDTFFNKKIKSQGEVFLIFEAQAKNDKNRFQSSFNYSWVHEIKPVDSVFEINLVIHEFVLLNNINGVLDRYDLTSVIEGQTLKLISDGKSIVSVEGSEAIVSKLLNELSVHQGVNFANFFLPVNLQKSFWPLFEPYFLIKEDKNWIINKSMQEGQASIPVVYQERGWFNKSGKIVSQLQTDMSFPGTRKINVPYTTNFKSKLYFDESSMPILSESYYVHQDFKEKDLKKTTTIRSVVLMGLAQ